MKMAAGNIVPIKDVIVDSERLINRIGMRLQSGNDFEVFKYFASNSDREQPLDPIFSPTDSNIEHVNGIWLVGRNADGDVVQTQAIRMLDLKGGTLGSFFNTDLLQIRPFGKEIDRENTFWRLSGDASKIQGNVAYHGGLWIRKDFRGGSIAALITRYLLAKALASIQPDYFIGLQSPFVACKGLSAREGYVRLEQGSIFWQLQNCDEIFEDWLVWMSADEARHNLSLAPRKFFELFERDALPATATA